MIKLNDLTIGYNGEAILEHIDQEFDDGLIYGILAKSGAGKTTLLKTISGLLHPVHGEVVIDGTTYRNADKNPVYMMHQRYSNFGWLSCTENVLIAQRDKKLRSRDDAIKVLAAVGLEQYADKWPSQLSGGMQQRLALARTLYVKPKYLLMDEPLSALDDKTRSKMQRLILDVHAETGNTIIMVTHSQDEAFKMCDKISNLMFYRIFLYKMFASSIFIFTFATENKYPMYPYADVQICYIAQKHIVKRYISKLSN